MWVVSIIAGQTYLLRKWSPPSDFLPDIYSDIYFDILFCIVYDVYSGILSAIYSDNLSDMGTAWPQLRSGSAHWDLNLLTADVIIDGLRVTVLLYNAIFNERFAKGPTSLVSWAPENGWTGDVRKHAVWNFHLEGFHFDSGLCWWLAGGRHAEKEGAEPMQLSVCPLVVRYPNSLDVDNDPKFKKAQHADLFVRKGPFTIYLGLN